MSKILKNTTASPIAIADVGNVTIPASPGDYTIPPQDYPLWAASSDVVTAVGSGNLVVNDGSDDLSISDGIDLIKGLFPRASVRTPHTPLNVSLTNANTEYSQALPSGTVRFSLQNRMPGLLKVSYTSGTTGSNYLTVWPGGVLSEDQIRGDVTLYFQSPLASQMVEISYWT